MQLLRDLCLVKLPPPVETTTPSGLLLAHGLPPAICYGKVAQVGPHVRDVAVGDLVTFSPSVGDPLDDFFLTPHLLVSERDIDTILEPEPA